MSQQSPKHKLSFIAGSDLSNALYKICKITGNQTVDLVSTVNDVPLGVISEPNIAGKPVTVTLAGTSKVVLGGNVNAGDVLAIKNDGTVVVYDSENYPQKVGIALEGGTTGSIIEMLIRIL